MSPLPHWLVAEINLDLGRPSAPGKGDRRVTSSCNAGSNYFLRKVLCGAKEGQDQLSMFTLALESLL